MHVCLRRAELCKPFEAAQPLRKPTQPRRIDMDPLVQRLGGAGSGGRRQNCCCGGSSDGGGGGGGDDGGSGGGGSGGGGGGGNGDGGGGFGASEAEAADARLFAWHTGGKAAFEADKATEG